MKRMVYILISVAGVMLAIIISVGCVHLPDKSTKEISGVSLTQRHMEYAHSYSFFLRKEGDRVIFDADVRLYEEPFDLIIEGCQVDEKYFDELIKLGMEQGIADYVNSYKKKPELFQVMDKTENTTTVYYEDGTDKSADSGEYKDQLYDFFTQLATVYAGESVTITTD